MEVRTDGNSLLKAVYLSRLRLTRLLLEGGAYINESSERGETPLMVACRTQHADAQSVPKHRMVRYLLESGADPNIQDKTGKTALMHACLERAGVEVVTLLLDSGADPSLEDHSGSSALVHAVNAGDKEALRVLLETCKAKGKEVIIITTDKLPSGRQMTKQYLNVPPPPDLEERLHYTPASCCMSPIQLRTPPQGASGSTSPQPGSPLLGLRDSQDTGPANFQPETPPREPSPQRGQGLAKVLHLQRLHSEPWLKIPPSVLQHSQSSLMDGLLDIPLEEELSLRLDSLGFQPSSCQHSSDTTGLQRGLEQAGSEASGAWGRKGLGRKMSYDSASASHSSSHPSLEPREPAMPLDRDSCLPHLALSSLKNVVQRRNFGMDHYSSDSQLPQFGSHPPEDSSRTSGANGGQEKRKLVGSRSSTLSGSRESLERRGLGPLERRGSGALLLDHISHTRPGYLPPLNPHAPIPDIGASPTASGPLGGSSKTLSGGPKPLLPCAPLVPCAPLMPKELKARRTLLRRHSMQTEQIQQLVNFEELFGH